MDIAMHIKYYRIYTVNLVTDEAVLLENQKETHIAHAAQWLTQRIRENVCEKHKDSILALVQASHLDEIFTGKD